MKATYLLLVIFSLNSSLMAQNVQNQKNPNRPSNTGARRSGRGDHNRVLTPLQQRALWMVDELYEAAQAFSEDGLKIRIQASIADLLWGYDEAQARRQFANAFEAVDTTAVNTKTNFDSSGAESPSQQVQLRVEILRLIAKRDPVLADKLSSSVSVDLASQARAEPGDQSQQAALSLQAALSIADANPKRAGDMALAALKTGINPLIIPVLEAIRRKDSSLADLVFGKVLEIASRDRSIVNVRILGLYVFPTLDGEGGPQSDSSHQPPNQVNAELEQQYLNLAFGVMMNQVKVPPAGSDQMILFYYQTIYKLLPVFDRYMPDRSSALRSRMDQISRGIPPERLESLTNPTNPARIQALLTKAESGKPSERDQFYLQAAALTARRGDTEHALSIAEKISNIETRADISSFIRYQAATEALRKKQMDIAYGYAKDITTLPQGAVIFTQMARALREEGDSGRALEILNDAERLLIKSENGPEKAFAMLLLADAIVILDVNRGFEVMASAITAINRADFSPEKKSNQGVIRRIPVSLHFMNFDKNLSLLSRADFDRALFLAQTIEMKELSLLAKLAVCRGVLITPESGDRDVLRPDSKQGTGKSFDQKR